MTDAGSAPVQILVIEDEDDIRNLVVMNLRRAGFEVISAGNGTDGLSLLREHRPPVLLLDLVSRVWYSLTTNSTRTTWALPDAILEGGKSTAGSSSTGAAS